MRFLFELHCVSTGEAIATCEAIARLTAAVLRVTFRKSTIYYSWTDVEIKSFAVNVLYGKFRLYFYYYKKSKF